MPRAENPSMSPREIEKRLIILRGVRAILGRDLAKLYKIDVRGLSRMVDHYRERFPRGSVIRLSKSEVDRLATRSSSFTPLKKATSLMAFTEYGVAALSSVLRSQRAIRANIEILERMRFRDLLPSVSRR